MEVLDNWGNHPSAGTFSDQRSLQTTQIAKEKNSLKKCTVDYDLLIKKHFRSDNQITVNGERKHKEYILS